MDPMTCYNALEPRAQDALAAMTSAGALLATVASRPGLPDLDGECMEQVLVAQGRLFAVRELQRRLVSDSTVERACDYAITELSTMAQIAPLAGPDGVGRRAGIDVYDP